MISVIIPAYNEESTIGLIVDKLRNVLDYEKHEIIVIDDGSTDKTNQILKEKCVKTIRREVNMKGDYNDFLDGLNLASGEIVIKMDADFEHDPSDITAMIQEIRDNKHNLVMGIRNYYSRWMEHLINFLHRKEFQDLFTGFVAFDKILLKRIVENKLQLWIELPIYAKKRGYSVKEIIVKNERREDKPKYGGFFSGNIRDFIYYIKCTKKLKDLIE